MKCSVLSLDKSTKYVFISQYGITLIPDYHLFVKEDLGDKLIKFYKGLEKVGTVEQEKLRYGHYEVLKKEPSGAVPEPIPAKADKSMTAKPRRRKKLGG